MDTITHGIVGALVGKAFFAGKDKPANFHSDASTHASSGAISGALSSPTARAAIVACTIGSVFPDIDIFAGPLARNPLGILEWHRNITHSLVMLPVWAVLLAAISAPLARKLKWGLPPFWKLAGIYAAGLGSHIFLDAATSYGTMVWSPLRYSRVSWDWLFIVDFTFSGIALAPQFVAWCYREPAQFTRRAASVWIVLSAGVLTVYKVAENLGYAFPFWVVVIASAVLAALLVAPRIGGAGFGWTRAGWCRVGMAALATYMVLAVVAHRQALTDTENFAAARHLQVESLAALPLPPSLTHWAGLITTPQGVWRTTFHLPGGRPEVAEHYAAVDANHYITEAKSLRDVQVYLWFARFPIWQVEHRKGETVAEVTDVRFFRKDFQEKKPASGGQGATTQSSLPGFAFQVVFDAAGNIISHGLRR